jgi:membrane protease YdiL (CAAX protease family)
LEKYADERMRATNISEPNHRRLDHYRLPLTLAVLVIWVAVVGLAARYTAGPQTSVVEFVSKGIAWPIVLAAAFLLLVVRALRWNDVGFNRFSLSLASKLMWLPFVYLAFFGTVALLLGMPPAKSVLFIAGNTMVVGLSEELMFRGVLFSGLRSRLGLKPSIWICCLLFGVVHILNGFQTGSFRSHPFKQLPPS